MTGLIVAMSLESPAASALLVIPDTYYDRQGDTLSTLDLGLRDVGDMDIGLGF